MNLEVPNPEREFSLRVKLKLPLVQHESSWRLDFHKESIKNLVENYTATEVEDVKVLEIIEVNNGNS